MILKPHLLAAKDDPFHPIHEHAQDLPDFDFIEAQQAVCAQVEPFISFFERDDNQQVGEYFSVVTHLCKWAGSPQEDNSRASRELQNHKERFDSTSDFFRITMIKNRKKRALLATLSTQMFQTYVIEKECTCATSRKTADCKCFTRYNRKVPLRTVFKLILAR